LDAHLDGALDRVPERVLAGAVALRTRESALGRPPAVAVHHDRDVIGHARAIDVENEAAHRAVLTSIGTDFIRRSRRYSVKPNSNDRARRRVRSSASMGVPASERSTVARWASSASVVASTAAAS